MNILLLGGTGFIGGHLQKQRPDWTWHTPTRQDLDLITDNVADKVNDHYDIVINAAGYYGGLPFNQMHGDKIMLTNTKIFHNVIDIVRKTKPRKFIQIGSACLYPRDLTGTINEELIGQGPMHPSVVTSGLAKYYQLCYLQNTDIPWEYLILTNVYGPGEPLDYAHSHFVGSLINRLVTNENPFKMIGTGAGVRDFLYVKDAVEAVCRIAELGNACKQPLNVSTGQGMSIRDITEKLISLTQRDVTVQWGDSKDDGILHKVLDNSKLKQILNFSPSTTLEQGLSETWNYYKN